MATLGELFIEGSSRLRFSILPDFGGCEYMASAIIIIIILILSGMCYNDFNPNCTIMGKDWERSLANKNL